MRYSLHTMDSARDEREHNKRKHVDGLRHKFLQASKKGPRSSVDLEHYVTIAEGEYMTNIEVHKSGICDIIPVQKEL